MRGIPCQTIDKVNEGRPNLVDSVKNNEVDLVINTPLGRESRFDDGQSVWPPSSTTFLHHDPRCGAGDGAWNSGDERRGL